MGLAKGKSMRFIFGIILFCLSVAPLLGMPNPHVTFASPETYEVDLQKAFERSAKGLILHFNFTPTPKHVRLLAKGGESVSSFSTTSWTSNQLDAEMGEVLVKTLPNLKRLTLPKAEITLGGLQKLSSMKHLSYLDLRESNLTNSLVREIGRTFSGLESLNMSGRHEDFEKSAQKSLWQRIKSYIIDLLGISAEVAVQYMPVDNAPGEDVLNGQAIAGLVRMPHLKYLTLIDVPVTVVHIGHIAGIKPLKIITISPEIDHLYHQTLVKLRSDIRIDTQAEPIYSDRFFQKGVTNQKS